MKIITLQNIGTIEAGKEIEVANNYGQQLISEGKAIEPGGKIVKQNKLKKHGNNRNS